MNEQIILSKKTSHFIVKVIISLFSFIDMHVRFKNDYMKSKMFNLKSRYVHGK